jgi:hypothetical protein
MLPRCGVSGVRGESRGEQEPRHGTLSSGFSDVAFPPFGEQANVHIPKVRLVFDEPIHDGLQMFAR